MSMDRQALLATLDHCVAALGANDHTDLILADDLRHAENCIDFPIGDGVWKTVTAIGAYQWSLADPVSGQAARFGTLWEGDDHALFVLRIAVNGEGAISECELLVSRPVDGGVPFLSAELIARPELSDRLSDNERSTRARMVELANGYFSTLQQNDGTIHTRFSPDCNRRENGVFTTNNPRSDLAAVAAWGCQEQFELGFYKFDNWIRARRYPLVDEVQGVVLAGGFIDHDGQTLRIFVDQWRAEDGFLPPTAQLQFP